jgi:outer membrane protein assembly factor BamB
MKNVNEFIPIWSKTLSKPTYSCSITNLLADPNPEIMVCCEDELFRAYNLAGKELFQMPFSSNITQFMASSITGTRKIELVSGDTNGIVRMVGLDGKQIWKTELHSPIISMDIGDIISNGKKEIIVGLQNRHVIVLDYLGAIRYDGEAPQPVSDVTLGFFKNEKSETMMVALKTGEIYALDIKNAKEWTLLFSTSLSPTAFTYFRTDKELQSRFLIGDKEGKIHIFDQSGSELGNYWVRELVRDIDKEIIELNGIRKMYVAVAAGKSIQLLELKETIISDVTPFPTPNSKISPQIELKFEFCPECGKSIGKIIKERLQKGLDSYCEFCGAPIHKN